ncbi:unnamed protein product, partial [Amoebophrya sp. A25]
EDQDHEEDDDAEDYTITHGESRTVGTVDVNNEQSLKKEQGAVRVEHTEDCAPLEATRAGESKLPYFGQQEKSPRANAEEAAEQKTTDHGAGAGASSAAAAVEENGLKQPVTPPVGT